MTSSPSTKARREEPVWSVGSAGGSRDSPLGHQTTSFASFRATAPDAFDVHNVLPADDITRSSPEFEYFSADDKPPPIPKRSSRRVMFHVPFRREVPSIGPSDSAETKEPSADPAPGEKGPAQYVMPPRVYGHWLALQQELKERFAVCDLWMAGDVGAEVAREQEDGTLALEPLNLGDSEKEKLGDVIMQQLRSSPIDFGDNWI